MSRGNNKMAVILLLETITQLSAEFTEEERIEFLVSLSNALDLSVDIEFKPVYTVRLASTTLESSMCCDRCGSRFAASEDKLTVARNDLDAYRFGEGPWCDDCYPTSQSEVEPS